MPVGTTPRGREESAGGAAIIFNWVGAHVRDVTREPPQAVERRRPEGGERDRRAGAEPVRSDGGRSAGDRADADDVSEYDLVLAALPAPVLAGALVGVVLAVPLVSALAVGSLGAAAIVGYALFMDLPRASDS